MLRAATYDSKFRNVPWAEEVYRGTPYTVERMVQLAIGPRGERSMRVRRHAEMLISQLRPKDYASEVMAVYYWWARAGRYTRDPLHVELLKDPERLIDDAEAGRLVCDCDDFSVGIATSCLVLGSKAQYVTVGFKPKFVSDQHTHVFARAQDPRTGIWWVLDPVAGRRTKEMLSRVKQYRIYDVEDR